MKSRRKRIGLGVGICAIASLLGSNAVSAEDVVKDAESLWKAAGFQISGTVLASYTQNFNNPNTNNNQLRVFDTGANTFMANMAQIVLERPANASGSGMDRAGFRARLNFGTDARYSRAETNYQSGTQNDYTDVQELYGEYIAPIGNGLKIQAGKINTLIGYEVVNAWENPNFSRSFMFGLGQAFTTTGVRFTYPFASWATATIGLINGWDNLEDNNRGKSFEYLVALTPHEKFGFSVYGSYGAEQSNGNTNAAGTSQVNGCIVGTASCDPQAKRTVVGGIITFKPMASTTLVLEPYYANEGNQDNINSTGVGTGTATGKNARWNGIIAYLTHDLNDQTKPNAFSLRIRGEIFEDAGGARTCWGGVNFAGGANTCSGSGTTGTAGSGVGLGTANTGFVPANAVGFGTPQTLWEGTFTLQYKPVPQLQTRVEFRYDKSDQNVFLRGDQATNNQQTLAFSVAYLF